MDKRKKRKFDAKRETRRLKCLADEGRLKDGIEIPRGAVPADPAQQVPNNSYSPPPLFYVDKEFFCADCGQKEIWSAQQQKWYYEVAKGSLYSRAVRCRECRRKHSVAHDGRGDPNPIKHVGSLMKRIRVGIEPCLMEAGFRFDEKNKRTDAETSWLDYSRPGLLLRCLFEPHDARLIAETLDDWAKHKVVANVDLSCLRSIGALPERVDDFTSAVREFVQSLPVAGEPTAENGT